MQNKFLKIFVFSAILFVVPSFAKAAAIKPFVSGIGPIVVTGSGFGTKATATPFYYSNYDSETIGQPPANLVINGSMGTVESNLTHSGNKSFESDFCADLAPVNWSIGSQYLVGYYIRYPSGGSTYYRVLNYVASSGATGTPDVDTTNYLPDAVPAHHCTNGQTTNHYHRATVDFGSGGADTIFYSFWLYLDKTTTTSISWQWKNINPTSCTNMYACAEANHPFALSENFTGNAGTNIWSNAAPVVYVGGMTGGYTYNPSAPSDMWLVGQWQRVDFYIKRNSADNASDGVITINRIGRSTPLTTSSTVKTHATGDSLYRYLTLNNGIDSVYTGYVDFKTLMDDVYVDTTPARVELCDTDTWAARTHCEIQSPTAWADGEITATYNAGSFTNGQAAYFYVVDSVGEVSPASDSYIIGELQSDTTAPSAPSGLSVM